MSITTTAISQTNIKTKTPFTTIPLKPWTKDHLQYQWDIAQIYARIVFIPNNVYIVNADSYSSTSMTTLINWFFGTDYSFQSEDDAIKFIYEIMHNEGLAWQHNHQMKLLLNINNH